MKPETALFIKDVLAVENVTIVTSGHVVSRYLLGTIADDIDPATRKEMRISVFPQRAEICCEATRTVAVFRSIHDVNRLRGISGKIFAQNKAILNRLEYEGFRRLEIWPDNYPAM